MKRSAPLTRTTRLKAKGGRRFTHAHVDLGKIRWLHRQPCRCATRDAAHCWGVVEAHHEGEPGERDDRKTVPLCALGHHREGPRSRHVLGSKGFERLHRVDLADEAARYEAAYQASR